MQAILKTEVNAIHKNNIFPEKTIILNKDNVENMVLRDKNKEEELGDQTYF